MRLPRWLTGLPPPGRPSPRGPSTSLPPAERVLSLTTRWPIQVEVPPSVVTRRTEAASRVRLGEVASVVVPLPPLPCPVPGVVWAGRKYSAAPPPLSYSWCQGLLPRLSRRAPPVLPVSLIPPPNMMPPPPPLPQYLPLTLPYWNPTPGVNCASS